MRLVAITRILNEADIVEAFVRHNGTFVDHHILLDNGSTDGTLEILEQLQAEGISLEVHHNVEVSFSEIAQLTRLFRIAAAEHGADWVVSLDADEFIDGRAIGGRLRDVLRCETGDVMAVRLRDYVPCSDDPPDEALVMARITHARPLSNNFKVMMRAGLAARGAIVRPGTHAVQLNGEKLPGRIEDGVVFAHYSTRSPWQAITKFTNGWSRVLAAGPETVATGAGTHYRRQFEILKNHPEKILLNRWFMEFLHDKGKLETDPLPYLGSPLCYTKQFDYRMRATTFLMTLIESLSMQVGKLSEAPQIPKIG